MEAASSRADGSIDVMGPDCGTAATQESWLDRAMSQRSVWWLTIVRMSAAAFEPLVSIVTPTLNQGRFIEATIRSIKAQTYTNFEHIVVDGGSTDQTLEILRRHESTYPMRWVSEPDRGMYDAVNKGMRLATGEILAYLNSDDLYFPWTLAAAVEGLQRHSDAGAVYGDSIKIDLASGVQHALFGLPLSRTVVARAGPWAGLIVQPTVFWRRSTMAAVGPLDDRLRYVGDREFILRIAAAFALRRVDEFLAVEQQHDRTLTRSQGRQLEEEDDRAIPRTRAWRSRARVRVYIAVWRRVMWARFLTAYLLRRSNGPWGDLLRDPNTRVSPIRAVLGQLPGVGRWILPGAIRSDRVGLAEVARQVAR